ncbi:MAG: PIN domain-containing protein [Phycisphaerales bacterium]
MTTCDTALIVLDTSALHRDESLTGTRLQLLAGHAPELGLRLAVPAVVLRELRAQLKTRLQKITQRYHADGVELVRLGLKELSPFHADAAVNILLGRRDELVPEQIESLGIEVLPIPEVDHAQLLEKALSGTKPFEKTDHRRGRGYQDAIIWESIKARARSSTQPIYFVTQNSTDFAFNDSLHPDLALELDNCSCQSTIHVLATISEAIEVLVKPKLESLTELTASINYGGFDAFDLADWASKHLPDLLVDYELPNMGEESNIHATAGYRLTKIRRVHDVKATRVVRASGNYVLMSLAGKAVADSDPIGDARAAESVHIGFKAHLLVDQDDWTVINADTEDVEIEAVFGDSWGHSRGRFLGHDLMHYGESVRYLATGQRPPTNREPGSES